MSRIFCRQGFLAPCKHFKVADRIVAARGSEYATPTCFRPSLGVQVRPWINSAGANGLIGRSSSHIAGPVVRSDAFRVRTLMADCSTSDDSERFQFLSISTKKLGVGQGASQELRPIFILTIPHPVPWR